MDKIKALLEKLGVELTADQYRQLAEVAEKEYVPAQTAAADKAKLEELTADYAAERLFGGYKFANDRVRKSVLDEFKGKGFKLGEDGEFVGGKEFLDGLKQSEPDIFAQEKGLFMDSTQSTASADDNNLATQIYSHFGLNNN